MWIVHDFRPVSACRRQKLAALGSCQAARLRLVLSCFVCRLAQSLFAYFVLAPVLSRPGRVESFFFSFFLSAVETNPPPPRVKRCRPYQEVGTTLLLVPHCMTNLQDFNDFCGWLEETIEGDEASLRKKKRCILLTHGC